MSLDDYLEPLESMFSRCKSENKDVIFMTPNMLNTSVAEDTPKQYYDYAIKTAEMQNGGRMDNFIYSAVDLANRYQIPVCDCYSKWKELSKTHNITTLLINRINHPTSEMHQLFATSLFDMIIKDAYELSDVQNLMFEQ